MNDVHSETELTAEERERLASLERRLPPPAGLEPRLVDALRRRALIRERPPRRWRTLAAMAASLALIATGFAAGRWSVGASEASEGGRLFMLLLYEDPETSPAPASELAHQQFEEYAAWAAALRSEGRFAGGHPLAYAGSLLRARGGELETAPGLAPAGQVLSGYFMVRAGDPEEAVRVARDCPHLRWHGTVAVRAVDEP